jgi:hypothetical protein
LRLNDYLQNLELEIDRATIAASASIGSVDPAATAASRSLVARFRTIRATGRVVLDIPQNAAGIDNLPNIQLEDGDRFVVPTKPSTVNVVGAVYDQNSFLFETRRRWEVICGWLGDRPRVPMVGFLHHPGRWLGGEPAIAEGFFGNTFASMHLNAGDTVVVPEKFLILQV